MRKGSPDRILVDSALIKFALHKENSLWRELALYAFLKIHHRSGYIPFDAIDFSKIADHFSIKPRSAKARFSRLINLKWITVNAKRKQYRLKGSLALIRRYKLTEGQAAMITLKALRTPQEAFIGALIGFQHKMQKTRRKRSNNRAGLNEDVYSQRGKAIPVKDLANRHKSAEVTPTFNYQKYTISLIRRVLGVSQGTASQYRKKAKQAGFLKLEEMAYTDPGLMFIPEMARYLEAQQDKREFVGRYADRLGERAYLRAPDKVTSLIPIVTRKHFSIPKRAKK